MKLDFILVIVVALFLRFFSIIKNLRCLHYTCKSDIIFMLSRKVVLYVCIWASFLTYDYEVDLSHFPSQFLSTTLHFYTILFILLVDSRKGIVLSFFKFLNSLLSDYISCNQFNLLEVHFIVIDVVNQENQEN